MKKNLLTDILFNWNNFKFSQKVQKLQLFENQISKFQGRKPRKIQTEDKLGLFNDINKNRNASNFYCRNDIKNIYMLNLERLTAMEALEFLFHEGFHAYVDDFINGRVKTLRLYSELDKERFNIEEENILSISAKFKEKNMISLFDRFFIEEKTNYLEDSIYISKLLLDSIENFDDANTLFSYFILAMGIYIDNIEMGKSLETKYNTTYEDVVIEALNNPSEEKIALNKKGRIVNNIDPDFYKFFKDITDHQMEYVSVLNNMFIKTDKKEEKSKSMIDELQKKYIFYILNNKAKRK